MFASTGATGTRTATLSDSDKSTAALIALRPAPSYSVALSETAGATETVRRSLSYRRDSSHVAGATNTLALSPTFTADLSDATPAVDGLALVVSKHLALSDVVGAAEALLRRQSASRIVGDTSPATEAVARSLSGPIEQFITVTGSGATASVSLATPKPGTLQLIGYHVDTGSVPAAPAGWTASRAAIVTNGPSTCFFYRRTEAGDTGAFSVANPASVAWGLHAWELNGISPGTPFAADSIASASTTVASLTSGGLVVAAGSSVRVFAMLGTSAAFAAGSMAFTDFTKQAEASDTRSASGRRYNPPEGTFTTTASWTNGRRAALTLIAFNTSTAHAAAFENAASADDAITRAVVGGRPLPEAAAAADRLVRAAVTSRSAGEEPRRPRY